jgi:ubiquitin-conjugating enzyme E2 T
MSPAATPENYVGTVMANQYHALPTPLSAPAKARLARELALLQTDPPPGIAGYQDDEDMSLWHADISGPEPYEKAMFRVRIKIPSRYPFEPPLCQFVGTMIPYHPNIDAAGRICLDTLKSPPAGSWSPAVSLPSLLLSLRSLLACPNPDDGLVAEISNVYRTDPEAWKRKARSLVDAVNTETRKRDSEERQRRGEREGRSKRFKETLNEGKPC